MVEQDSFFPKSILVIVSMFFRDDAWLENCTESAYIYAAHEK